MPHIGHLSGALPVTIWPHTGQMLISPISISFPFFYCIFCLRIEHCMDILCLKGIVHRPCRLFLVLQLRNTFIYWIHLVNLKIFSIDSGIKVIYGKAASVQCIKVIRRCTLSANATALKSLAIYSNPSSLALSAKIRYFICA